MFMSDLDAAHFFYVCDGKVLKNIDDLKSALKGMNNDAFSYHCNGEKNDFRLWISDSIGNKDLASKISRIKTKEGLIKKLEEET